MAKSKIKFLNPAEKAKKYARELKTKTLYTNDGKVKTDQVMTSDKASYRIGYLSARKDNARAYNSSKQKSVQIEMLRNEINDLINEQYLSNKK